ncbi:STAS domain-containing protein [Streptomyces spiralis]
MPKLMSDVGGKQWSGQASEHGVEATVIQYEWRGAWVVAAHGSYDMHSIPPLADALAAAARKHPKVVLDASGVVFADSSFLNLLILTHQAGTLRVAAPPQQLRRLFAITGVDTVLEIRETVEDAAVS